VFLGNLFVAPSSLLFLPMEIFFFPFLRYFFFFFFCPTRFSFCIPCRYRPSPIEPFKLAYGNSLASFLKFFFSPSFSSLFLSLACASLFWAVFGLFPSSSTPFLPLSHFLFALFLVGRLVFNYILRNHLFPPPSLLMSFLPTSPPWSALI